MSTSQEDTNTTTQTLQQDVQASISTLLQQRQTNNSDIAIDVYRAIRNESYLLVERQLILDALDNDPFGLMKVVDNNDDTEQRSNVAKFEKFLQEEDEDNGSNTDDQKVDKDTAQSTTTNEDTSEKQKNTELITRIKSMLRVISCTRTTTMDGYSSINAVVQFDNDGSMDKNVKKHIRLHFTFLREPQNDSIDTAVDNGKDISVDVDVEEGKKGCCRSSTKCNTTTSGESNSGSSNGVLDEQQPAKKRKRITKESDVESTAEKDEGNINDSQSDDDTNDNCKGGLSPKTIVTYKIDYSIDYGKQHQLLGVDIYALGKYPSVEEAVPMFDDDIDDVGQEEGDGDDNDEDNMSRSEEDNAKLTSMKLTENDKKQSTREEFEDIVMSDEDGDDNIGNECCKNQSCYNEADATNITNDIENEGCDRFGVHINPENVVSFLDHMNINFNEQSVFYFLLTFPFYEHEWDISGFLLTALFDDEDEDEEDEEEVQMMNGETMDGCESECPLPCCVPCNA